MNLVRSGPVHEIVGLSRKFCSAENFGLGPIFSEKIVLPGTNIDEKMGRC